MKESAISSFTKRLKKALTTKAASGMETKKILYSLLFVILTSSFSFQESKHLGTWISKEKKDIGFITFDPEGYATLEIGGKPFGGKDFSMQSLKANTKYKINYATSPLQVDITISESASQSELGKFIGIMEFVSPTQMKLRALANAPALIDVVTSQSAVSSDARKGLGFVPDYQPLTAWDDAEIARRKA